MTKSKNLINESIVSFFFLGRAPIAPGTFGSFGSFLLAYFIVQNIEQYTGYLLFSMILIMYYIGLQVAPWCEEKYGKDPSIYVLDEVIGYLIPISILIILNTEITPQIWILSFIAFRVFDVLKIWPAKDLEKIEGGHGILLDDVAAGFQTLILILLCMQLNLI
jgi:phosphatidylglycerophosphatase A